MKMSKQDIVSFSMCIFGLALSIYGLWENHPAVICTGAVFFIISTIILCKYIKLKTLLEKTNITIDGKRIDSLNIANLTRDPNKSLKVQSATHTAKIEDNQLELEFVYSGYCKSKNGESGFEFSIDSDTNVTFEEMECHGFDLKVDPEKKHKLYPSLVESDGLTKKIMLPFSNCIKKGGNFNICLYCKLPNCMSYGKDYVSATLSFEDDEPIETFTINLEFIKSFPKWLRVYDAANGQPKLIKDLSPSHTNENIMIFTDNYSNIDAKTALVYFFHRQQNCTTP